MGGNVNAGIKTEDDVLGPFDLGQGYEGFLFCSPGGRMGIIEGATGGMVGDTLEKVRADIAAADPEVMKKQILWACDQVKGATMMPRLEFWEFYERSMRHQENKRKK